MFCGEFGVATLAVSGWVSERVYWVGRRPSSSQCAILNCVLDEDSSLGVFVILSPVAEGWAVGCFPEQLFRRYELMKRSFWMNGEPTW